MQNRLNTGQDEVLSLKLFSYFEWLYETVTYSQEFKKENTCKNLRNTPKKL